MAIGSFSSGGILSSYGWQIVLWVSFVPLVLERSLRPMLQTENDGEPFVVRDVAILRKLGTWPEKNVGGGDTTGTELFQRTQP